MGYKIQIVVYSYKKISFPPGTDLVSIAGPDARDVTGVMELMMIRLFIDDLLCGFFSRFSCHESVFKLSLWTSVRT